MDYLLPLGQFAEKLFPIHLKDAKVHQEKLRQVGILAHPLKCHSPRLPGRGDINWVAIFVTLQQSGHAGLVVIEFENKEFELGEEAIVEALLATKKIMESLLPDSIT
jgi:sugar phosphate isomerase/epimerase